MHNFAKVVWSEGSFIGPQHLQQLDRYHENNLNKAITVLSKDFFGVTELVFDNLRLKDGVVEIKKLIAVFKDGTVYTPDEMDLSRLFLNLEKNINQKILYLMISVISETANEVNMLEKNNVLTRYYCFNKNVSNTTNLQELPREISLAKHNVKLMLEDGVNKSAILLPIGIVSTNNEGEISFDNNYIPPYLYAQNESYLASCISEIHGLLLQKIRTLSNSVNNPNRGGIVEIVNFLTLQTVNRYQTCLLHEKESSKDTHPASLFLTLSKLCADLSTFLPERTIVDMPVYNHNDIYNCFKNLMAKLRVCLSTTLEQRALRITLSQLDKTTYSAQTPDKSILDNSRFILAINADVSEEILRQNIPTTMKISSVEKIKELVGYQVPGVKLLPLATVPQEIPFNNGYVYFELDKQSLIWSEFNNTSGMAFHLAGDFPNAKFEFWAIRTNLSLI